MDNNYYYLRHSGVIGMKWGHKKHSSSDIRNARVFVNAKKSEYERARREFYNTKDFNDRKHAYNALKQAEKNYVDNLLLSQKTTNAEKGAAITMTLLAVIGGMTMASYKASLK